MGHTRIVFTDATTAEAITVLKSLGYMETAEGGCFLNQRSPLRIYSAWGKALYYPDLLDQLDFTPRIQIHFKCPEDTSLIAEVVQATVQGLTRLQSSTKIKAFNVNTGKEIIPALKEN